MLYLWCNYIWWWWYAHVAYHNDLALRCLSCESTVNLLLKVVSLKNLAQNLLAGIPPSRKKLDYIYIYYLNLDPKNMSFKHAYSSPPVINIVTQPTERNNFGCCASEPGERLEWLPVAKMKRQMSIRSASGMEPGDYGYGLLGYAWDEGKTDFGIVWWLEYVD